METAEIYRLTERALNWRRQLPWIGESAAVVFATLAELSEGEPAHVSQIAARAGVPTADVLAFLEGSPAEFDHERRLIGFGISLVPTPHRLELDGRWLYTWCAPDALGLPAILGKRGRIESPCFASGEMVRIELVPDRVLSVDPEKAVVSILMPDIRRSDFRRRLCDQQHFFKSAAVAEPWLAERPQAAVVPVRDGFAVTRGLLLDWLGAPLGASDGSS